MAQELHPINIPFVKSAEHGWGESKGVNWGRLVTTINMSVNTTPLVLHLSAVDLSGDRSPETIALSLTFDSYVTTRRRMLPPKGTKRTRNNYTGLSYTDIHQRLFLPYVKTVVALIEFVKENPDSTADQSLIDIATKYRNTLYTVCQHWTEPEETGQKRTIYRGKSGKTYERSVWHSCVRGTSWRPARNIVIDQEYNLEEEIWVCMQEGPPPIQRINVEKLLNDYGEGPPDWMKGLPDDLAGVDGETEPLPEMGSGGQGGGSGGTGGSQRGGGSGGTGGNWAVLGRGGPQQGPGRGGSSQGQGAGAGATGDEWQVVTGRRPGPGGSRGGRPSRW